MKSLILKASAGTGKTYRLSLEYIASLLNGESYRDIVVMTFTIKATAEIKDRVIDFLEELYRDRESELYNSLKNIYPDLNIDEERVKKIYKEISENKDRLKIYTIDSFINTIFKTTVAPYLKLFSYEIIDSSSKENMKIVSNCFETILEDKESFEKFKPFLENKTERRFEKYIETIKNIVENRWKFSLVLKDEKLNERERFENSFDVENCIDRIKQVFEKVVEKRGNKDEVATLMSSSGKWITKIDRESYRDYLIKNWSDILKAEKFYDGRKISPKSKIDCSFEIECFERFLNELKEWISKEIFNQEIYDVEKQSLAFIEGLYEIYDNLKINSKKITHSDISNYVFENLENEELNLIRDEKITEYFKEIFDSNLSTIFIDEFQDTSIVQWKILINILKTANRVICVGDEKQSIYGWRGGEKELFENLSQILEIEEESLNTSYRNKQNIIKMTNHIFSNISQREDINWGFIETKSHSEESGAYEIIEKSDEINGISAMINHIKEQFNSNYQGIAIIARSNKQLEKIAMKLAEERVPYILESSSSIIYQRAINPIYRFLRFLVGKEFFSLIEFLRTDLICITNNQLKEIIRCKQQVLNYIFSSDENIELDKEIVDILERVRDICNKGEKNQNFIVDFIKQFELTSFYQEEIDLKNIFKMYKISKEFDNLSEFYNTLSKEFESEKYKQECLEKSDGIILMSIHKSKGLEFDTVYFYYEQSRGKGKLGLELYIDFDERFECVKNCILMDKKYEKVLNHLGDGFNFLNRIKRKVEEEEINNLYVALTRAKNNLILINERVPAYLKEIIENMENRSVGEIRVNRVEDKKTFNSVEREFNLTQNEIYNESYEVKKIDFLSEEKRILGKAIHYYLEFIIYNELEEHKVAREKTFSKYASLIGAEKLDRVLKSDEFKEIFAEGNPIFSKEWSEIYPEYEIYYEGKLRRLDRLMIKKATPNEKGKVLIIDYKTGKINQEQLDEYVELIKKHIDEVDSIENYTVKGEFLEINLLKKE